MDRQHRTLTHPALIQKKRTLDKLYAQIRRTNDIWRTQLEEIIENSFCNIMTGRIATSHITMEYILNLFLNVEATTLEKSRGIYTPQLQSKITCLNNPHLLSINDYGRLLYAGYDLLDADTLQLQQVDFVATTRTLVHREILDRDGSPRHRYPRGMWCHSHNGDLVELDNHIRPPQGPKYKFSECEGGWTISLEGLIQSLEDPQEENRDSW